MHFDQAVLSICLTLMTAKLFGFAKQAELSSSLAAQG
jgi:hypothetical protein